MRKMTNITVSELIIYPVKSCAGINLDKTSVEAFGLKDDRRWMVVDENGEMVTQRKLAKMCLIQPELISSGLILTAPLMEKCHIEIPIADCIVKVKVWNDICQAYDAGDVVAEWLSYFLSTKCRLVYFPEDEIRQVDLGFAIEGDKTAFSDGFPLLLLSQASLDDLNSRLTSSVSIKRFRPNIVVNGCEPFAEDTWNKIKIGNIVFRIVKPCSRCVIPSINPETAIKEDEPLKTLVAYRKREKKIFFGQNVIANDMGIIEQGFSVEVIE